MLSEVRPPPPAPLRTKQNFSMNHHAGTAMTGLNTSGVCPTFTSLVLFECIEIVCPTALPLRRRRAAVRNKSNVRRVVVADVPRMSK